MAATAAILPLATALALGVGTLFLGRANRPIGEQRDEARLQRDRPESNSRTAREAVDTYLTQVSEEQLLDQPGMEPLREKLCFQGVRATDRGR